MPSSRLATVLRAFVVAACAVAVLYPSLKGGFLWNDREQFADWSQLESSESLRAIWTLPRLVAYPPLTATTFWIEWPLWSTPAGHRATNAALHAVAAVLVLLLLHSARVPGATFAAVLFAVHPVALSAVAWIAGREFLLAAVFSLTSLLSLLRFQSTREAGWYGLALVLYVLALLSGPSALAVPLLLLGWSLSADSRRPGIRARACLPFLVLAALDLLLLLGVFGGAAGAARAENGAGTIARLAHAAGAVWFYLGKAVWPARLAFVYADWGTDAASAFAWLPLLALAAAFALLWRWRSNGAFPVLAGFGWFVASLVPFLGLIPPRIDNGSPVADPYQYFALVGLAAMAAAIGTSGLAAWPVAVRPAGRAVGVLIAVAFAAVGWRHARVYADEERLWSDAVRSNPASVLAHTELAFVYLERGDLPAAERRLEEVLRLRPDHVGASDFLATIDLQNGRYEKAARRYEDVLRLRPDETEIHKRLSELLTRLGDDVGAIAHAREVVRLRPREPGPLNDLAWMLATAPDARARNGEEAVRLAEQVVAATERSDPAYVDTLAAAYAEVGRFDEAVATQREAVQAARGVYPQREFREMEARVDLFAQHKPHREIPRPLTRPAPAPDSRPAEPQSRPAAD